MKFIDFFAGIGGFRRGMELAGHECDGMVERWRETEEEAVEQWNRRVSDKEDTKC